MKIFFSYLIGSTWFILGLGCGGFISSIVLNIIDCRSKGRPLHSVSGKGDKTESIRRTLRNSFKI